MQSSRGPHVPRSLRREIRRHRRPLFGCGLVLTLAGAAAVAFPGPAILVVGVAAGWLLWLAGAMMIGVTALIGRRRSQAVGLAAGALTICAGALLMLNPATGAFAATLLITGVLILDGAFEAALALDLRPLAAWRWVLASALASVLAGVATAAAAAAGSRLALAALLGVALASSGVALMRVAASGSRRRPSAPRRARLDDASRQVLP